MGFRKIAVLFILILTTIESSKVSILIVIEANKNKIVGDSNHLKLSIRTKKFLTLKAKVAFTKLWQTFIKTLIFWHFDLKCYIQIKTNISGYDIGKILS